MQTIIQGRTNLLSINDLFTKTTIPNPYYIFQFVDFNFEEIVLSLRDESAYPERFSSFYITDASDATFKANGEFNIYESAVDVSTVDASLKANGFLHNEMYSYERLRAADVVYRPNIYTSSAVDKVFDPIFEPGPSPITSIPHDDLLERDNPSNHPWAVPNASIGLGLSWVGPHLQADINFPYVDVSLSTRDASITDLRNKNIDQDASIVNLQNWNTSQDASIVLLQQDDGRVDASLGSLFNKNLDQDASIVNLQNKTLDIDASLVILQGKDLDIDASLVLIQNKNIDQDASIVSLQNKDLGLDASIVLINSWQLSQDASIVTLQGKDVTLDASIVALQGKDIDQDASIKYIKENFLFGVQNGLDFMTPEPAAVELLTKIATATGFDIKAPALVPQGKLTITKTGGEYLWISDADTITYVDGSLNTQKEWNTSQDASIINLQGKDLDIDASLVLIQGKNIDQDASISNLRTRIDNNDTSLGLFNTWDLAQDVSIKWLQDNILPSDLTKTYVDGSLGLRDTSIDWLNTNKQAAGNYIKDSSNGNGLVWNNGLLDVSTISMDYTYVDGSLGSRDTSIAFLNTNKQDNIPAGTYVKEASLGTDFVWVAGQLDVSILAMDYPYIDGSFGARDTSISWLNTNKLEQSAINDFATNASVGLAIQDFATNSSVNSGYQALNSSINLAIAPLATNASVGLALLPYATNASVGTALLPYATNASVGTALLPFATNSSVNSAGFAQVTYTDGSLGLRDTSIAWLNTNKLEAVALDPYATNASTNSALSNYTLKTYTDGSLSARDVSIAYIAANLNAGVSKIYVDGSFGLRDTSIGFLNTQRLQLNASIVRIDVSLNDVFNLNALFEVSAGATKVYIDGSLAARDTSIAWLNANRGGGSLGALTDVSIVSASTGHILMFDPSANDSKWHNYVPIEASTFFYPKTYIDATLPLYIKSASTGTTLKWVAGVLDVSALGDVTKTYTDGSLGLRDTSIAAINTRLIATDVSVAWNTTRNTAQDASLNNAKDITNFILSTPATKASNATGVQGNISFDASYFYICTSTNTWGRILLTTGY
jgi:hypothetical protein